MSPELQLRYRAILDRFSMDELARLPLAYTVYGDDLGALVSSIAEDSSPLKSADLSRFYALMAELANDLQNQVDDIELQNQNETLDETERETLQAELAVLTEATYSKILAEYFFLMGLVELIGTVREAIVERHGEGSSASIGILIENTRRKIIEIFQEIDGIYESVQGWIATNSR